MALGGGHSGQARQSFVGPECKRLAPAQLQLAPEGRVGGPDLTAKEMGDADVAHHEHHPRDIADAFSRGTRDLAVGHRVRRAILEQRVVRGVGVDAGEVAVVADAHQQFAGPGQKALPFARGATSASLALSRRKASNVSCRGPPNDIRRSPAHTSIGPRTLKFATSIPPTQAHANRE